MGPGEELRGCDSERNVSRENVNPMRESRRFPQPDEPVVQNSHAPSSPSSIMPLPVTDRNSLGMSPTHCQKEETEDKDYPAYTAILAYYLWSE